MHIERLRILQRHLEAISSPKKQKRTFNMGVWFSRLKRHTKGSCGTAACALGEGALLPELRKQGLRIKNIGSGIDGYAWWVIAYGGAENDEAAATFFGISFRQARYLFMPDSYMQDHMGITPAMVAKRIDQMIADHEKAAA